LKLKGKLSSVITLETKRQIIEELVTGGALTTDEIVAICSRNECEEDVNDSPTDEVEIEEQNLPSRLCSRSQRGTADSPAMQR
jgi:hypothetical protein